MRTLEKLNIQKMNQAMKRTLNMGMIPILKGKRQRIKRKRDPFEERRLGEMMRQKRIPMLKKRKNLVRRRKAEGIKQILLMRYFYSFLAVFSKILEWIESPCWWNGDSLWKWYWVFWAEKTSYFQAKTSSESRVYLEASNNKNWLHNLFL